MYGQENPIHRPAPPLSPSPVSEEATTLRKAAGLDANNSGQRNSFSTASITVLSSPTPKGFITHFNEPYGRFLGVDPKEQVGKHATEVIENTRMHIVAQTGRSGN